MNLHPVVLRVKRVWFSVAVTPALRLFYYARADAGRPEANCRPTAPRDAQARHGPHLRGRSPERPPHPLGILDEVEASEHLP